MSIEKIEEQLEEVVPKRHTVFGVRFENHRKLFLSFPIVCMMFEMFCLAPTVPAVVGSPWQCFHNFVMMPLLLLFMCLTYKAQFDGKPDFYFPYLIKLTYDIVSSLFLAGYVLFLTLYIGSSKHLLLRLLMWFFNLLPYGEFPTNEEASKEKEEYIDIGLILISVYFLLRLFYKLVQLYVTEMCRRFVRDTTASETPRATSCESEASILSN